MKKLLILLATGILGSTPTIPNIIATFNKTSEYNNEVKLQVKHIPGIEANYSVPASIQSVLDYFHMDIKTYNQERIFNDLGEKSGGVPIEANIGEYLNNIIPEGMFGSDYADNIISKGFGNSLKDLGLFQYYVLNSLLKDHPIIIRYVYTESNKTLNHAILITGIRPNTDPELTLYYGIDPDGSAEKGKITFNGTQLYDYFDKYSGVITGYQSNPDFQKDGFIVAIDDWNVDRDNLVNYENQEVIRISQDLTTTQGINTTGEFQNQFKEISLDESKSKIELMTNTINFEGFSIPVVKIPNNDDKWISEIMTIHEAHEDQGLFFKAGKVSAQLAFHRSTQLQHLILTIIIYMAGGAGPIGQNNGHVIINTGTILNFISNK